MAFNKILVSVLLGSVAGQSSRTFPGFSRFSNTVNDDISTTTAPPIPILKYIDQHNNDGSYTYGYQSADGTYKLETRLVTGEVRGKYGYVDSNGELKETTYGATVDGFKPIVDGLDYSKATANTVPALQSNLVESPVVPQALPALPQAPRRVPVAPRQQDARTQLPRSRFQNFKARNFQPEPEVQEVEPEIKIVNGRRAVLKRRKLRVKPTAAPAFQQEKAVFQQNQEPTISRQEELEAHKAALNSLIRLQQSQGSPRFETGRSSESARSFFPALPRQQQQPINQQQHPVDPYFSTGVNLQTGTYSISY